MVVAPGLLSVDDVSFAVVAFVIMTLILDLLHFFEGTGAVVTLAGAVAKKAWTLLAVAVLAKAV